MIKTETDRASWDGFVLKNGGHPLQLSGWGDLKAMHGWRVERVMFGNQQQFGAQLLIKPLPWPLKSLVYVPRGPFSLRRYNSSDIEELVTYVKHSYHPTHLSIEPHLTNFSREKPWVLSDKIVLIPHTLILDLSYSETELLEAMAKKTRQYIRKSEKESIEIIRVDDSNRFAECMAIYQETADRAGFSLHNTDYYEQLHSLLGDRSVLYASICEGSVIAFVWLVVSSDIAFELYGGVNDTGQKLRANYALKWHAIRFCKELSVREYDMNGLLNDGISTFKRGFASHENTLVGTVDYPMSPLYTALRAGLPILKKIYRVRARLLR